MQEKTSLASLRKNREPIMIKIKGIIALISIFLLFLCFSILIIILMH